MADYRPRIADAELSERLQSAGAVLIEGPKASGKTATARRVAASEVLLDVDEEARRAMAVHPRLVLDGPTPRLIDEWQVEPAIWNHVRRAVDLGHPGTRGRFILTGSAVPPDDLTRHTGAGRVSRLRLHTMTLLETGLGNGRAPLADLLRGTFPGCDNPGPTLEDIAAQICRGGWPGELDLSMRACLRARRDYLDEICRVDISRADGVRRDPDNVRRVLRSLARNVATTVSTRTMAADAAGGNGRRMTPDTVGSYLAALGRLMIYDEQPAWSPHLRSRSILRQAPKRHLADPSLAAAALGASPERLLRDLTTFGTLFESLVWHELAVFARTCDATVHHYRDNTGLEVDALVETRQGDWCAFEAKLGAGQIDAAAATLLKLRDRIDPAKSGRPSMLGVIVSTGYGYVRDDDVAVIPIGALGP